jgi:hypothetical protein
MQQDIVCAGSSWVTRYGAELSSVARLTLEVGRKLRWLLVFARVFVLCLDVTHCIYIIILPSLCATCLACVGRLIFLS